MTQLRGFKLGKAQAYLAKTQKALCFCVGRPVAGWIMVPEDVHVPFHAKMTLQMWLRLLKWEVILAYPGPVQW